MPIIASRASGASSFGFAAVTSAFELVGSYDALASATVGATSLSTITFAGIPTGYRHLQLRMSTRTDFASASPIDMYLQLNDDDNYAGYRNHRFRSDGATTTVASSASYDLHKMTPAASSTASVFSGIVVDLIDYANASKNTTVRYVGGADLSGSGHVVFGSILWPFTPAINRIHLRADGSFVTGSTFALYGVK